MDSDQQQFIEIKVGSKLTVWAAELNGEQGRVAQCMAKNDRDINHSLALYAVRKMLREGAGQEIFPEPKNDGDLKRVAQRFTFTELTVFAGLLSEANIDPELEEQAKKLGERLSLG